MRYLKDNQEIHEMLSGTCTEKKNIAMFLKSSVTGLLDYEIFDQKK